MEMFDAISINPNRKQELKSSMGSIAHKIDGQCSFYGDNLTEEQKEEFSRNENSSAGVIYNVFIFFLELHNSELPCISIRIFLIHREKVLVDKVINTTNVVDVDNFSSDGDLGHQYIFNNSFMELLEISNDLNLSSLLASERIYKLTCAATVDFIACFQSNTN